MMTSMMDDDDDDDDNNATKLQTKHDSRNVTLFM
jgi:hypothetical protein